MRSLKIIANRVFVFGLIFAFADQLSKVIVQRSGKIPVSLNDGIAFSIKLPMFLQILATVVLLSCVILFSKKIVSAENTERRKGVAVLALSMVLGGGLGNLVDRINMGYVVDFIDVGFWPVFNLADSFVSIGAAALAVLWLRPAQTS